MHLQIVVISKDNLNLLLQVYYLLLIILLNDYIHHLENINKLHYLILRQLLGNLLNFLKDMIFLLCLNMEKCHVHY